MGDNTQVKSPIQYWYRRFYFIRGDDGVLLRISKVRASEQYRLEVFLDNDTTIILNMQVRLNNIRFMALKDPSFFAHVTTDGQYVRWGDQVEISLNEVFHLAQK